PGLLNAAGVRISHQAGRAKQAGQENAVQGEEPQGCGAVDALPNNQNSMTAVHGKQGTKTGR
ncbi:MAG: hypothetical protein IK061_03095, partial [Desulfovibrio sp.]|nr:hypothetical protein [Desulfovibrio sp.]